MIEDNKIYDAGNNVWKNESGRIFIKNVFDPDIPVFVDITGDLWSFVYLGEGYIQWNDLSLPDSIESAFKVAIKSKLKSVSYGYLNKCRLMLSEFSKLLKPERQSLSEITMSEINSIWKKMSPNYRAFFRELYTYLADIEESGASYVIASKLQGMKARSEVRSLKDVLNWHPTRGALTQDEEKILRNAIEVKHIENPKTYGIRLFCWLLIATLKRGKQIRELKSDCLKTIAGKGKNDYFVEVKPVKGQTGDPMRLWSIPELLYQEMKRYSSIPEVNELQQRYDRFWVLDCPSLHHYGVVDAASAKSSLQLYIKKTLKLISPRTSLPLHLTPTRIRHTGATRLAYSGVSRDIIAEILEHDGPHSCQAYIDAVGSELCPSLEKADRNMGSLFTQLNQAYFKGTIVKELTEQPIILPDFSAPNPLFVGSCGRNTCSEGRCTKHPFVGCYNGCTSFLAWREADHRRALAFADKELKRWSEARGNHDQVSTIKEYEELKENILLVIKRIEVIKDNSDD